MKMKEMRRNEAQPGLKKLVPKKLVSFFFQIYVRKEGHQLDYRR
jgi:hypothetical protein